MDQQNMEKFNKTLNIVGLILSSLCIITSVAEKDTTEAFAWGIITLYNLREVISDMHNTK